MFIGKVKTFFGQTSEKWDKKKGGISEGVKSVMFHFRKINVSTEAIDGTNNET